MRLILEYQLEQLEQLKIDVFDLKLELKLALDKVKSGNFNMVDIYIEGLKPRLNGLWQQTGRTPKKKEIQLVSENEINECIAQAQLARQEFLNQQKAQIHPPTQPKPDAQKPAPTPNS